MSVSPIELELVLQEKLRALTQSEVRVENLQILAGGASQEMWRLDLHVAANEPDGDYKLVLRRQLGGKIYRDALDVWREFHVMQVAYASNVAVPYPQAFLPDLLGRPAALVHFHPGETIGRRLVREPAFENARKKLPGQMGEMLARIHQIDFVKHALLNELPHPPPRTERSPQRSLPAQENETRARNESESLAVRAFVPYQTPAQWILAQLENNLDEIGEPHPALELGIRWLRLHEPAPPEKLALIHGDYRIGNVIVNADGLVKVLDWEFAHIGDPYEDLAWSQVRDWRFGSDHLRFGGVSQPDEFFDAYGTAMNLQVDRARVHYWEVMGNARWAVGMLNQAQRHLRGEEPNLEFASLGRRCAEVELEILGLIKGVG
ncbi:MAG: phosphotransferase family protein [Chloroflexi bacterium]|nr:phosphotransferase family protein [Chloroflexota bacterium]